MQAGLSRILSKAYCATLRVFAPVNLALKTGPVQKLKSGATTHGKMSVFEWSPRGLMHGSQGCICVGLQMGAPDCLRRKDKGS